MAFKERKKISLKKKKKKKRNQKKENFENREKSYSF